MKLPWQESTIPVHCVKILVTNKTTTTKVRRTGNIRNVIFVTEYWNFCKKELTNILILSSLLLLNSGIAFLYPYFLLSTPWTLQETIQVKTLFQPNFSVSWTLQLSLVHRNTSWWALLCIIFPEGGFFIIKSNGLSSFQSISSTHLFLSSPEKKRRVYSGALGADWNTTVGRSARQQHGVSIAWSAVASRE